MAPRDVNDTLGHQTVRNVIFGCILYFIKCQSLLHSVIEYLDTLRRQTVRNVIFGCILYLIKCQPLLFSNRVPGYSTASNGEKCHFWVYLVFYQVPTTSTFSNRVPGYSTVSNGEKCHFWVYLVFYQVPTTSIQ